MKKTNPVPAKTAHAVLAALERRYRHYLENERDDDLPKMVENWEPYYMDGARVRGEDVRVPWAILWESGPDDWAYRFTSGGVNEELAILTEEFLGKDGVVQAVREGLFTEKSFEDEVLGVRTEPATSFIVEIWPA